MDDEKGGAPADNTVAKTAAAFATGGAVESAGFSLRDGQTKMAALVAGCFDSGEWGAVEAPCGSGKGIGYLVPGLFSIQAARADADPEKMPPRLVISTGNLALQEQLVRKDIPAVAAALGMKVSVAQVKSVQNYVCQLKLGESLLKLDPDVPELEKLADWLEDGAPLSGKDKDSVPFQMSPGIWQKASTDSEGCVRENCPHWEPKDEDGKVRYSDCPYAKAVRRAGAATVVVTNHAYLSRAYKNLAREGSLLVVDEAHALEDSLRGAGIREVRRGVLKAVKAAAKAILGVQERHATDPVEQLLNEAERVAPSIGRAALYPGWTKIRPSAFEKLIEVADQIDILAEAEDDKAERARTEKRADMVRNLADKCVAMVNAALPPDTEVEGPVAFWVERTERDASLGYGPADVAPTMDRIRREFPAGVVTSATLAAGGDLRQRLNASLGLDPGRAAVLPSPFDLPRLGVLVVPKGCPSPSSPDWLDWVCAATAHAVREARGGALVLCSSLRAARAIGEFLRAERFPFPIMVQGEAGRGELRASFAAERDSVLVGSRSFYEGLDVQGDSCRLVVIDKIPFAVPGDPLDEAAGALAAQRTGGSPFSSRALPNAAVLIAQAAGRLVRSPTDRGAVVVMDPRVVASTGVGVAIRAALPPFPLSSDIGDVGRLLRGEPLAGFTPRFGELGQVAAPMATRTRRRED